MRSPSRSRLAVAGLVSLAVVALAHLGASTSLTPQQEHNLQELAGMSPALRQEFSRRLAEFDKLPPAERQSYLEMERRLLEMKPEDRALIETLLRQFHLLFARLSDEEKANLHNAQTSEEWRESVVKILNARNEKTRQSSFFRGDPAQIRDQFGGFYFNESLATLKIWETLAPEKKKEIARRSKDMKDRALTRKILSEGRDLGLLKFEIQQSRKNLIDLQNNPEAKSVIRDFIAREAWILTKAQARPVDRTNLQRFLRSLPEWQKSELEALSPAMAQRALELLYRAKYPTSEMPDAAKKTASPNPNPPSSPDAQPNTAPSPPNPPSNPSSNSSSETKGGSVIPSF